ncbi:MAG: hypothetical protein WBQ86_02470 [Candidatus Binatus sp.]
MNLRRAAALALVGWYLTRHAVAFALVGWYLMLPPTDEMLDSACQWKHSSGTGEDGAVVVGESDSKIVQCDLESLQLNTSAELSRWKISGVFGTLADCQADQKKPLMESDNIALAFPAHLAFDDDQKSRPKAATRLPDDFVKLYVQTRRSAMQLSQCIASDDPRLKQK